MKPPVRGFAHVIKAWVEGVGELLAWTTTAAQQMKSIKCSELKRVVVDTTAQEKNVVCPTGSRLLEMARARLIETVREQGIVLRQSYQRNGPRLARRAGCYALARQYKRMRRCFLKGRLGDAQSAVLAAAGCNVALSSFISTPFFLAAIWAAVALAC